MQGAQGQATKRLLSRVPVPPREGVHHVPIDGGNVLYYGDNLDVLRRYVKDESVDLVYLDPPFNSNANYNVLFAEQDGSRAAAQVMAFEDTWRWDQAASAAYEEVVEQGGPVASALKAMRTLLGDSDMLAYLAMMAPRLVELHRALKPTGALYLHCDPTASHYLKLLLDAVFGPANFRNEIIWKRTSAHSGGNKFGPVHDTIFSYAASELHRCVPERTDYSEDYLNHFFRFADSDGRRYRAHDLTAPGTRRGDSGLPWRGVDPTNAGRHWAVPGFLRPLLGDPQPTTTQDSLDRLEAIGRILWPKKSGGTPSFKQYVDDLGGAEAQDLWTDIAPIGAQAAERLGYPTQKPLALLERIINSSSQTGNLVLDPFCGCGTAIDAAQKLGRRWIGIDITHLAVGLIKNRLVTGYGPDITATYSVVGEPTDLAGAQELAAAAPFEFQAWALGLVGARRADSNRRGADTGIDGRRFFHDEQGGATKQVIYSVKAGQVHRNMVAELLGVVEREKAAVGVFISMEEPTGPMRAEAASAGFYTDPWGRRHPRIQLFSIADLLAGRQPDITDSFVRDTTLRRAPRAGRPVGKGRKGGGPPNLALFSADDLGEDSADEE